MSQLHHCLLERERTFIFGALKQMVALLRIRIEQLEVKTICMYFRAQLQLFLHSPPYGLDLYSWNPDLTTYGLHLTKKNQKNQPNPRIIHRFFWCDYPVCFCTTGHSEGQQLEFSLLASCHVKNESLSGGYWGFTPNKGSVSSFAGSREQLLKPFP